MTAHILQLSPLMPAHDAALTERYIVHRLFDAPDPAALLARHGALIRGVVTGGGTGIPAAVAAQLPVLEIVAINGVGYDKVDLAEARRRGYRVTNTPDVLTDDVADLAIGLIIAVMRQMVQGDRHVRDGKWPAGELPLGTKVSGRRFGIYGLGRIGLAIARRLEGFGGTIAYSSRTRRDVPYAFADSLTALAAMSDVLILAVAASANTRGVVDRAVLDALGPQGVLVNIARGSVVDEPALVLALAEGRLGGAGLDVFADEPRVPAALWAMPNVVLLPHIASATHDTRTAMGDLMLANLDAHFAGEALPTAVV